jgi:ATP-dependent DNA helicase RecG
MDDLDAHDPLTDPVPADAPSLTLGTRAQFAPGVGPHRAKLFEKLDIHTVADLIKHLPHRYEFESGRCPIDTLPEGSIATAEGVVCDSRWIPGGGSPIGRGRGGRGRGRLSSTIEDDSGQLQLVWFNASYLRKKVRPGVRLAVTGKVATYNDLPQMANPKVRILDEEDGGVETDERFRPVYPATEGLSSDQIDRIVRTAFPLVIDQIEDHLTDAFRKDRALPTLRQAYQMMHSPDTTDDAAAARRRLAYDELLLLQLGFALKRRQRLTETTAPALRFTEAIDAHIRERFPFELTNAQNRVVQQIGEDLQRSEPMNRLLQGDVGSGKTIVALYAMLMAVASERQAALMAPTELLADQHFISISNLLDQSTVRMALLTGSLTRNERESMNYRIERGDVDLVVGTQAILTESVQFNDLAVMVVDEQHRFGVAQRAAVRNKSLASNTVPHTLVMTATPIPRTLSLSVFGDLDVSIIDELPPGRQPITTRVVGQEKSPQVYDYVASRLADGEQAYVVVPTVDDGEAGLKAVRTHVQKLENGPFADRTVAPVHGQMDRITRERIMHRFRAGKIDVLVATTVIEVGVDVPNASLMIVEHAERFGLAQLHQLRGRVGRGSRKSLCVFIADPTTEDATHRMAAIGTTTDGFKIAIEDLKIRGMGEFFGTKQSGLPPLKIADLERHTDLLQMARRDAQSIVAEDPDLATDDHTLLRKRLIKQYDPAAIGLADVG